MSSAQGHVSMARTAPMLGWDTAWGGDAERAQTPRHAVDIHGVGWGGICAAITLKGEVDEPEPKAFV